MAPFLTAHALKQNLNSREPTQFISAMSYVGGIADYLMKNGQICPPGGSTVATAADIVRSDLNRDSNEYRHLSAARTTER